MLRFRSICLPDQDQEKIRSLDQSGLSKSTANFRKEVFFKVCVFSEIFTERLGYISAGRFGHHTIPQPVTHSWQYSAVKKVVAGILC